MKLGKDRRSAPQKAVDAVKDASGDALGVATKAASTLTDSATGVAKQVGGRVDSVVPGSPAARIGAGLGAAGAVGAAAVLRRKSKEGSSGTPVPDVDTSAKPQGAQEDAAAAGKAVRENPVSTSATGDPLVEDATEAAEKTPKKKTAAKK